MTKLFDEIPYLQDDRIILRRIEDSDADALREMIENVASERVLEKNDFMGTSKAVPEDWGYPEPTIADKWFR